MFKINDALKASVVAMLCFPVDGAFAQSPEEARQEVESALHHEANAERGKKVFEICAVCHLPEGWGTENGVYPQLAGQHPSVIIKQLADIRARNRDNPTMLPFTSPSLLGGTQEIADVAAYISQLPMTPHNGVGPGNDLEHGGKVYKDNCVECHGDHGEGNVKDHVPRIHGQHYNYLLRQFEWIRTGKRRNADSKMAKQIRNFTMRDELAVMDYISRQRPPKEMVAEPGWRNPDFPKYARGPRGMSPIPGPGMPMMPGAPMGMPQPPMPPQRPMMPGVQPGGTQ